MAWVDISKPTGTNYTNVSKPGGNRVIRAGMRFGLMLLPLTVSKPMVVGGNWSNVNKPSTNNWVNINKPT